MERFGFYFLSFFGDELYSSFSKSNFETIQGFLINDF